MKKTRKLIACICLLLIAGLLSFKPNSSFTSNLLVSNCDSIPELNKKIMEFVKGNINYKVGQGESWDLAAEALTTVNAKWDNEYKFGRLVDYKKECVYPGDILYLVNARIEYKHERTLYTEKFPEHVAIIYEVSDNEDYTIAEQNTGRLGQKVGLTPLTLSRIKTGKIKIFRPETK